MPILSATSNASLKLALWLSGSNVEYGIFSGTKWCSKAQNANPFEKLSLKFVILMFC